MSALRNRLAIVGVVAGLSALAACGGGRSTTGSTIVATPVPTPAPTASAPTSSTPSAIDGITGAAVAAVFTPPAPANSAAVQTEATGYLVREQTFEGTPIALWPGTLEYVDELVYDWEFTDGSYRMVRWERPFVVTLDGDLATDPQVVAKTREVLTEIGRVTGLVATIGAGGSVVVRIDPSVSELDAVAVADVDFRGANVIGADVRFETRQEISGGARSDYRNTLLHEMGHVMGLGHSPSTRDVMTPGAGPGTRVSEYQPDEATCLTMMYFHRRAGNFMPDRDPALGVHSTAAWRARIVD
jgi:Matrixin